MDLLYAIKCWQEQFNGQLVLDERNEHTVFFVLENTVEGSFVTGSGFRWDWPQRLMDYIKNNPNPLLEPIEGLE